MENLTFDNFPPESILLSDPAGTWHSHWNMRLILMSLAISSFGSFMCLQMITLSSFVKSMRTKLFFIAIGGIALAGCGIWLMHFTGMLAMSLDTGIKYDWWKTALSMIIAFVCCAIGATLVLFPIILDKVSIGIRCLLSPITGLFSRRASITASKSESAHCLSKRSSRVMFNENADQVSEERLLSDEEDPEDGAVDDHQHCMGHIHDDDRQGTADSKSLPNSVVMDVDKLHAATRKPRRGSLFGDLGNVIDAEVPSGDNVEAVSRRWFMILDRIANGTLKNTFYSSKTSSPTNGRRNSADSTADDEEPGFILGEAELEKPAREPVPELKRTMSEVSMRAKECLHMWATAKHAYFSGKMKTFSDIPSNKASDGTHNQHGGGNLSQIDDGGSNIRTSMKEQVVAIITGLVNRDVLVGGPIVAVGAFGMHYVGVNAMYGAFEIHYDMTRVIISAVIALVAGIAALSILRSARRTVLHLICALVMGIAVCAMHYTAMSACTYVHTSPLLHEHAQLSVGVHQLFYHRAGDHVDMIDGSTGQVVQVLLSTVASALTQNSNISIEHGPLDHHHAADGSTDSDTSVLIGTVTAVTALLSISLQIAVSLLVEARTNELEDQKRETERLLLSILPLPVARRMKAGERQIHEEHRCVTMLFADIVGFTELSSKLQSSDLVFLLNSIFSIFDDVANSLRLTKIKTIGDCYMLAGGLPYPRDDHAQATVAFGLIVLRILRQILHSTRVGINIDVRIGVHSGPVTAGVIGKQKFLYDVWGDTVNVASRMESSGKPGCVQVSSDTYELIKEEYQFEQRDSVPIKGKGIMTTYFIKEECQV